MSEKLSSIALLNNMRVMEKLAKMICDYGPNRDEPYIKSYSMDKDGRVNVVGDMIYSMKKHFFDIKNQKFIIKFNKIDGDFDMSNCKLEGIEIDGFPKIITGSLDVSRNTKYLSREYCKKHCKTYGVQAGKSPTGTAAHVGNTIGGVVCSMRSALKESTEALKSIREDDDNFKYEVNYLKVMIEKFEAFNKGYKSYIPKTERKKS